MSTAKELDKLGSGGSNPPSRTTLDRLVEIVETNGVVRSKELAKRGIHPQFVRIACRRNLIKRVGRGVYASLDWSGRDNTALAVVCKRVPKGVICLESALHFYGLTDKPPKKIWVACDRKGWRPCIDMPTRLVRFSGDALTQGLVNTRMGNVPVRVYSAMKTIADCFKYRNKIGIQVGVRALRAAIDQNKYNRQKLLRFAEICRVKKIVMLHADEAEKCRMDQVRTERSADERAREWDRDALQREVWSEPLKHVARKYGVSDVALAKRCKKLDIQLPGRGYWAKKYAKS
jgi:predicted transcriptional regulator of viral defense system